MPKFCMPTYGNGRNNTKTACICLYRVGVFQHELGNPALFLAQWWTCGKRHVPGFRQTVCVCLAEKLALVAFRLFPRPLWFHAIECCGAVGREPAYVASKVCQFGGCEDRLSACAARYSPARVLVLLLSSLLSMLSGEIYLRLNEAVFSC